MADKQKPPSVAELEKRVIRMGMATRTDTKSLQAAVILLGAALGTFKQSITDISAKSGYNLDHVRSVVRNIRINGIWRGGKTVCNWGDKEFGGMEFACDCACARGWIRLVVSRKRK